MSPISSELSELLKDSWVNKAEEFKHKVMRKISSAIGIHEYYNLIQKYPVKLSDALNDLGPILRL